ncbi:MAG TPA: hypothetical protein VFV98_17570 [Vicinamibacterales bacterium]|nr:hypothetical protein [Vicinamibacterales bacterium]
MSTSRFAAACFVSILVVATAITFAQQKAAVLGGKWSGAVKADIGEMPIEVTLKVENEAVKGDIKTFHGSFHIDKGELQKDGRWKLSFTTDDGGAGSLIGAVKDDSFAGDWDFRPNAVGTFTLTRVK